MPTGGIFEILFHRLPCRGRHLPLCLAHLESGAAVHHRVQGDAVLGQQSGAALLAVEKDQGVVNLGLGGGEGVEEAELAAAVGDQVFHQKYLAARFEVALHLGGEAVALGLLAHVDHRLAEGGSEVGREGDARGFATGDGIGAEIAVLEEQAGGGDEELHGDRIGDHPPAVHVDRTVVAGGQAEGLLRLHAHRPQAPEGEGDSFSQAAQDCRVQVRRGTFSVRHGEFP